MTQARLLPTTPLGRWAGWLMAAFFALFLFFQVAVLTGQTGGDTFWENPLLAIPITLAGIAAVAGGVVAAIAIFKEKDRSVVAIAAIALAVIVAVFATGELVSPH